jgi:lysyl-tRNA synthetase class 2
MQDAKQNSEAWRPSASLDILRARAQFMADLRQFFTDRHYLEVETPIMGRYGITDPYLANIKAHFHGHDYALQTSPEYHMKRLLAAGSGPIFQIARVFRDDELGRWHNPEFTLLEWYQLDIDHLGLLAEVDALLQALVGTPPIQIKTYQAVFEAHCGFHPLQTTVEEVRQIVRQHGLEGVIPATEQDIDQYLFLLMSHIVEPALAHASGPTAVIDFPISQASLAQIVHGCAARFEVYYRGIELANGFYELTDPTVQAARFQADNAIRAQQGKPVAAIDENLLQALEHGLPSCSGVALGVDRLFALAVEQSQLSHCLAFDVSKA